MKWSLRVGKILGIDVYVHFTFVLLLVFLGWGYWQATQQVGAALEGIAFTVMVFGCVFLHELGHAFMARRFGIGTRDITLLPIGGLARLERMPEAPAQEFWVAVAGPAVNVAIATILVLVIAAMGQPWDPSLWQRHEGPVLPRLVAVNLFLVLFNLLPAFPMDGGRVLRALLATKLGRRRATALAANIGQAMAIGFGVVGFFSNPFLIFIAIFVYLGAQAEAGLVEVQSALGPMQVRDAMMTRFRSFTLDEPLDHAVEELLAGAQQDFPVVSQGAVVGILRRNDLVKALAEGRRQATVGETMHRDAATVEDSAPLIRTVEGMQGSSCGTLPVTRGGRLVGLLTLENVSEIVMIHAALERSAERSRTLK